MIRSPRIEYSNLPAPSDNVPSILRAAGLVLAYSEECSIRDGVLINQMDVVIQIFTGGEGTWKQVGSSQEHCRDRNHLPVM